MVKIKINQIFLCISLAILIVFSASCSANNSENKEIVSVVDSESRFDEFTVNGDKVYIRCEVTLRNTGSNKQKFKMAALCTDDVEIGLLKKEKIYAVDKNGHEKVFVIEANSQKLFEEVVFLGEYGGTYSKSNRLLPEIIIEQVN